MADDISGDCVVHVHINLLTALDLSLYITMSLENTFMIEEASEAS